MTDNASLQPANPAFADVVRASFDRQATMRLLGARLGEIAPGRVVVELPYGTSGEQGLFDGGAIAALGDVAGGCAALSLMPAGSTVVTVDYKVNFVHPANSTLLRAQGSVLRAGKSVTVARIKVTSTAADGGAIPVALLQGTFVRVAA